MFGKKQHTSPAREIADDLTATAGHLGHAAKTAAHATKGAFDGAVAGAKDSLGRSGTPTVKKAARAVGDKASAVTSTVRERLQKAREHAPSREVHNKQRAPEPPDLPEAQESEEPSIGSVAKTLTPLLTFFLSDVHDSTTHGKGDVMDKSSKQVQKEAKRRAKDVAKALRGERKRRFPAVAAAFAIGTAVGALASVALRQNQDKWTQLDLNEKKETAKAKLGAAASTVKDKTSKAAHVIKDKVKDARQSAGARAHEVAEETRNGAKETSEELRGALRG